MAALLETWGSVYANHAALRTVIQFLHVVGLVAGGGSALAADRITLRAAKRSDVDRRVELATLHGTHRVVVLSLVAVTISGLLLFGADLDMYLHSTVFWLKMALIVLLLVNGTIILRASGRAERGHAGAWEPLRYAAIASIVLWTLTTLAGAALPNLG